MIPQKYPKRKEFDQELLKSSKICSYFNIVIKIEEE